MIVSFKAYYDKTLQTMYFYKGSQSFTCTHITIASLRCRCAKDEWSRCKASSHCRQCRTQGKERKLQAAAEDAYRGRCTTAQAACACMTAKRQHN